MKILRYYISFIIRYGINNNNVMVSDAKEKYCRDNRCRRGSITRGAIAEKLKRDRYIAETKNFFYIVKNRLLQINKRL